MLTATKSFSALLNRVRDIVARTFPVEATNFTARVSNLRWENVDSKFYSDPEIHKDYKTKGKTLSARLVGTVSIIDNTSKRVIAREVGYPLSLVPHITSKQAFIIGGKDVQVVNQLRLKPGTYTRYMADNNVETFINTPGGGYRVQFDRERKIFRIRVGQSTYVYLYPILMGMGVPEEQLRKIWGGEIMSVNRMYNRPDEMAKLYKKLRPYATQPKDKQELADAVIAFFKSKPLDADITKLTLGSPYSRIEPKVLVAASEKALKLAQGKVKADDTENLAYKSIHSVEDFIPEKVERAVPSIRRAITRELNRRQFLQRKNKVMDAVPPSLFTTPVLAFFTQSEFTRYSDQNNPLDMASVNTLTTTLGEGGISSVHAVTDRLRTVHPSHAGVLDPLATPEGCFDRETEVMVRDGWVSWPEATGDMFYACLDDDGKLFYSKPDDMVVFDHDGEMYGFRSATTEYLVTPEHRIWSRPFDRGLKYRFESAQDVHGKQRKVRCGGHGPYQGTYEDSWFFLPGVKKGSNAQKEAGPFWLEDWADFLGWWLSEGSLDSPYKTVITQRESVHREECEAISELLDDMGLSWNYSVKAFQIHSKQLTAYLKQFGKCNKKFIPEDAFEWPTYAKKRLLDSLMAGDGRKGRTGRSGNGYCSTSKRLAEDVQRLAFDLGISTRITFEPDDREEHYLGCWIVHLHYRDERQTGPPVLPERCEQWKRDPNSGQYIRHYSGKVYCAQVPGGRLYVRRNGKGGHWSGNTRIGITGHLSTGARKIGNDLGLVVIDPKTGREITKKIFDLEDKAVAFYDQYDFTGKKPRPTSMKVKARVRGELKEIPANQVDYVFADPSRFFGIVSNAIPFLHTNSPNRALMASRHLEQAVPLSDPDVPSVQAKFGKDGFETVTGKLLSSKSPVTGTVTAIRKSSIIIRDNTGKTHTIKLHDHYPLNSNAFLHERPIVNKGQRVKKGDILADSDFTRQGALAMGKTLRTAFIPYKGYNFEDGVVVSESAAQKLTSTHKHEMRLDMDQTISVSLTKLLALFPTYTETLDRAKYGPDGVIRKGSTLLPEELVIPAVRKVKVHEDFDYSKLHKALKNQWLDVSVKWDGHGPAEVVDVVRTRGFVSVYVKTHEQLEVGDKLSHRAGGKGIVTAILPDGEMYKDNRGNTIDLLYNPASVLGRANPGQLLEAAAGKVAEKTKKPYLVNNFGDPGNALKSVQAAMRKAGVTDLEDIYDPTTNKKIPNINVGTIHFIKLRHQVSKKLSARGTDSYTHDETPARVTGKRANPLAIGTMELYSLLSGGGTAFLRDAATIKSSKNDEYWRAVQLGLPLPSVKTPFIVDKFTTYMKGAGIDLKQEGTKLKALPLIDKEIKIQSNGEVTSPGVVKANDLSPEAGGLFDRALTGGYDGNYWNHIELESTIPNPLMDDAIVAILAPKIKKREFNQIVNGTLFVTPDGKLSTESKGNKGGGDGLKVMLDKIDVKSEMRKARKEVRSLRGVKRDMVTKKLRFLRALDEFGLSAADAYLNKLVPIIPAKFRPIYPNPDGSLNVSDPIHGYREVILINNQIKDLKKLGVDDKNIAPLRAQLYGAVRGLVGLQEPLTRNKNFRGFLSTIKGKQNKFGLFQGRVLKRRQDLTGRSTIIPDPKLGIDDVKLPDEMAFVIYRPYIMQKLRALGHLPLSAREMIEKRDPIARAALVEVMKERPVLLNRAPTLHKFGILSFNPTLTSGKAIKINPLVVGGFNADFDGDAMQVHVPVSEDARREAVTKLKPSSNLFSPRDDTLVHGPSKEMLLGIYLMTKPEGRPKPARSYAAVLARYKSGKSTVNQAMRVGSKTVCAGQIILNDALPQEIRPGYITVDKRKLMLLLSDIARKKPQISGQVITKVKDLGNKYVTEIGFSVGLKDLEFPYAERDKILAQAAKDSKRVGFAAAYGAAGDKLEAFMKKELAQSNRFVIGSTTSGAFGKANQVMQTIATPVAVTDHEGKVIPIPIKKSLAEGMDIGSYWSIIPGSRKGLVDKGLSTADTGAFGKMLIAATVDTMISMRDCGTTGGITMKVVDPEALDRVVARGAYKGKVTTPALIRTLKGRGKKTIIVRSPLHCKAQRGICAKCFGLLENGQFPTNGYHIGTLAGQTISEPMTQQTLRTFHTGGTIGGGTVGFPRLKQILEMPTNVRGKATLTKIRGKVNSIKKSAAGGWDVVVDDMNHFVPQEQGLGVRVGARVRAGDKLSLGGVVKPQELLEATNDIRLVQDRIIDDMNNEVFGPSGIRVKRKILETAIQPMTNRAEVSDPGDADIEFGVHSGDIVQLNKLDNMNRKLLARKKRPVQYTPTLLSIRKVPQYHDDFIGQLVAEKPHRTLKMAPSLASQSDIGPSGHPIATYAFGRYFNVKPRQNLKKTAEEIVEDLDEATAIFPEIDEEQVPTLAPEVSEAVQSLMTTLGVVSENSDGDVDILR